MFGQLLHVDLMIRVDSQHEVGELTRGEGGRQENVPKTEKLMGSWGPALVMASFESRERFSLAQRPCKDPSYTFLGKKDHLTHLPGPSPLK